MTERIPPRTGQTRRLLIMTACLVGMIIGVGMAAANDAGDSPAAGRRPPTPPTITFVDEPSPIEREAVNWAVARYVEAGLQLPDLEIAFPATCDGLAGRYHVGLARVDLCRTSRRLVLHEFAHAWDDTGVVDREAFMLRRGLDHWYEHDGASKHDSGGEQLAHLVTWGLLDVDTRYRAELYEGQPILERPRRLKHLEDVAHDELVQLFIDVTGVDPLVPEASDAATRTLVRVR